MNRTSSSSSSSSRQNRRNKEDTEETEKEKRSGTTLFDKILLLLLVGIAFGLLWTIVKKNRRDSRAKVMARGYAKLTARAKLATIKIHIDEHAEDAEGAHHKHFYTWTNLCLSLKTNHGIDALNTLECEQIVFMRPLSDTTQLGSSLSLTQSQMLRRYRTHQNYVLNLDFDVFNEADLPSVLDTIVSSGAKLNTVEFRLNAAGEKLLKEQALKMASINAKEQAIILAKGQGQELGDLDQVTSFYAELFNGQELAPTFAQNQFSNAEEGGKMVAIQGRVDVIYSLF